MMKRVLFGLGLALLLLAIIGATYYHKDSQRRIDALLSGGTSIETSAGTVEYHIEGEGDDLLFFHGTPGGYDQGIGASDGVRVITFSRPGYLGTPLSTGSTPAQQADAAAALLDALGVREVAVMGASGGGPAAYTFAAAFPERTVGLVAMEAISHSMPTEDTAIPGSDWVFWMMIQSLVLTQDNAGVVRQIAQNESDRAELARQPQVQAEVADLIWSMWPLECPRSLATRFDRFSSVSLVQKMPLLALCSSVSCVVAPHCSGNATVQ